MPQALRNRTIEAETAEALGTETARLEALRELEILDTPPETCFDTITQLATFSTGAECSSLTFVDETRVWTKSKFGCAPSEVPRRDSEAEEIVAAGRPVVILDLDRRQNRRARTVGHQGSGQRFFAGVPVRVASGQVVGALCIGDLAARERFPAEQIAEQISRLESLADLVSDQLELRRLRVLSRSFAAGQTVGIAAPESDEGTETMWPGAEELREALRLNQFVLHYQPEFDLRTGRIVGLEALIRWRHPERGMVPPQQFIPRAEENGLILPLGDWGLSQACRQMQQWRSQWPSLSPIRVSVNLSARQFSRAGLADHVASLLTQTGLSGRNLGLEMTESSLTPNLATAMVVLGSLQRLGISLQMDDFGTGYSSLSHLHRFAFDVLKVDRSFVHRMTHSKQASEIVRIILDLARALRMDVVAEGIETEEQLRLLTAMGCGFGQGFLLARPMPPEQITELLASASPMFSPQPMRVPEAFAGGWTSSGHWRFPV